MVFAEFLLQHVAPKKICNKLSDGSKPAVATESLPDGFVLLSPTVSGSSAPAVAATDILLSSPSSRITMNTRSKGDHKKSKTGNRKRRIRELPYYVVFSSFSRTRPTRTVDHRGMGGPHVRAKDLDRQALIVKRKKAARYVPFSSCVEYIFRSNLSHACPSWGIFGCPFPAKLA